MTQPENTEREKPLLIVHADGSVELSGTEAENEIAIGKALAAMAFGFARVCANHEPDQSTTCNSFPHPAC